MRALRALLEKCATEDAAEAVVSAGGIEAVLNHVQSVSPRDMEEQARQTNRPWLATSTLLGAVRMMHRSCRFSSPAQRALGPP